MQERARGEGQVNLFADAGDGGVIQRLHRRLGLTLEVAEGGEVVMADQHLGGGVHGLDIQRLFHMPDQAAVQRRRGRAVEDAIEVAALGRRKPRVPVALGDLGLQHRDGLGPTRWAFSAFSTVRAGQSFSEVGVDDLAGGVDAGVGAAGRLQPDPLTGEVEDRRLDRLLHRGQAGALRLIAVIGAAVIFERQAIARHQPTTRPAANGKAAHELFGATDGPCPRAGRQKRTAPSPQAIFSRSSRASPGAPVAVLGQARHQGLAPAPRRSRTRPPERATGRGCGSRSRRPGGSSRCAPRSG
jgi:hypothetical protein